MSYHNISSSIISLANPWLDFLNPNKNNNDENEFLLSICRNINNDLNELGDKYKGKVYGFGSLPTNSNSIDNILEEINYISNNLNNIKGIIMSTNGFGNGLDDKSLIPIFKEIEKNNLFIFLHPHYKIQNYFILFFIHPKHSKYHVLF